MTAPLVSVIIPVYNAAPFLSRCLDSVLAQTCTDWELITVNDGSSDGSAHILARYARACPERISFLDGPNRGVVKARATALEHARGAYLFFLDGDDYLPPNALERLLNAMQQDQADMAVGSYTLVWPEEGGRQLEINRPKRFVAPREALLYCLKNGECFLPVKLYRTELFRKHVHIPEQIRYQEDLVGLVQYTDHARRCTHVEESVYYYVRHHANVTGGVSQRLAESFLLVNNYLAGRTDLLADASLAGAVRAVMVGNLYAFHSCGACTENFPQLYPHGNEVAALLASPLPAYVRYKKLMVSLFISHPRGASAVDAVLTGVRKFLSRTKARLCRIF